MKTKLYLKHTMSCLRDLALEADIDHDRREVRLFMSSFDSSLVAQAVTRVLPDAHQVVAFRDDAQKDASLQTNSPSYELFIHLAGVAYRAQVAKLIDGREVAVTLEPSCLMTDDVGWLADGTRVSIGPNGHGSAERTSRAEAPTSPRRRLGLLKGKLVVPEDFDAPLPDDVRADFEG